MQYLYQLWAAGEKVQRGEGNGGGLGDSRSGEGPAPSPNTLWLSQQRGALSSPIAGEPTLDYVSTTPIADLCKIFPPSCVTTVPLV
jgi:hypothetical protein